MRGEQFKLQQKVFPRFFVAGCTLLIEALIRKHFFLRTMRLLTETFSVWLCGGRERGRVREGERGGRGRGEGKR